MERHLLNATIVYTLFKNNRNGLKRGYWLCTRMRLVLGLMIVICICVVLSFSRYFAGNKLWQQACRWGGKPLLPGNSAPSWPGDCTQMRCVPYTNGKVELILETCSSIGYVPYDRENLPFPDCCPYPEIERDVVDNLKLTDNYDDYT